MSDAHKIRIIDSHGNEWRFVEKAFTPGPTFLWLRRTLDGDQAPFYDVLECYGFDAGGHIYLRADLVEDRERAPGLYTEVDVP